MDQCSPTPPLQQRGAVLCPHRHTAQENRTITMQIQQGFMANLGSKEPTKYIQDWGKQLQETSTNYQWPSLILFSTFSWKPSFQDVIQNMQKLSYFSANPHTSKDSVKHRYCQSHIHKSHITIQHLKHKLHICKQISSLKQLAALILDGNSVFLFTEHQQRSQSCI